jgi:hypothetical protein
MKNADQPIYPISEAETDRLLEYPQISLKGLTKREELAARAMQGLLSNPAEVSVSVLHILKVLGLPEDTKYSNLEHWPKYIAALSFQHADALLNFLEDEKQ